MDRTAHERIASCEFKFSLHCCSFSRIIDLSNSNQHSILLVSYVTDEFTDLSLRLAYSVTPEWQISLVGKQLLDPSRVEMVAAELGPIPTAVQRSVFLQVDWAAR